MSFYQNVFPWEFIGNWVLGDRQASLSFRCPANTGRGDEIVRSWGTPVFGGIFNLAGNDLEGNAVSRLWIQYAQDFDNQFRGWRQLTISISGAVPAATTITEIITALNADATFALLFTASVGNDGATVVIRQRLPVTQFRFYIDNHAAETVLLFNARAGVAELPSYFDRHTIRRRFAFSDGNNHLIDLSHVITEISSAANCLVTSGVHGLATGDTIIVDNSNSVVSIDSAGAVVTVVSNDTFNFNPVVNTSAGAKGNYGVWARLVDNQLIANAVDKNGVALGYTLAATRRDYELLQARAGIFTFHLISPDPTDITRPIRAVEFPAGATAGNLGKIIKYQYNSQTFSRVYTKTAFPGTTFAQNTFDILTDTGGYATFVQITNDASATDVSVRINGLADSVFTLEHASSQVLDDTLKISKIEIANNLSGAQAANIEAICVIAYAGAASSVVTEEPYVLTAADITAAIPPAAS